jgi:deoxyribonuclease V
VKFPTLHRWDLSQSEAVALQRELAARVHVATPLPLEACRLVAGADVSYNRFSDVLHASVVVLSFPDLEVVETADVSTRVTFPYVPGLLSFREAPPLLAAFAQLASAPDAVLFDGQGTAHPRRLGIASHLGLWLEVPCVGCAKSRLTGRFVEPDPAAGSSSPLMDGKEQIGAVLRTKNRVNPLFVSPGHLIDLASSLRLTLACVRGYRLPEPTRRAHLRVNEQRRLKGDTPD